MLPLEVQIDAVDKLRGDLRRASHTLDGGEFRRAGSTMTEFGGFDNKHLLDQQHKLAHGIVLATIETQIKSLDSFYDALVDLQRELDDVDDWAVSQHISASIAVRDLESAANPDAAEEAGDDYVNSRTED